MSLNRSRRLTTVLAGVCLSLPLLALAADKSALVKVDGAWIRPAVPGQTATGGFMQLTATKDLVLVGLSTPAAGESALHEMSMEGDVMRMRAVPSIALPAGQAVSLQSGPGHQHLMLMGLKQPLKVGDEVSLTLKLRQPSSKKTFKQEIKVPVKNGLAAPAMEMH